MHKSAPGQQRICRSQPYGISRPATVIKVRLGLTLIGVPNLLSFAHPTPEIGEIGQPWYLAWAGLVYIAATLVTLGWIIAIGQRVRPSRAARVLPGFADRGARDHDSPAAVDDG